ncbi:hypothetical protein FRX31_016987 [Thalictrum thalictroides]|uniref:Uncharacterized protein n=1 Tax=Thalictrum thalictroides TaxID=46969 RepID=A0A7J6W7P6_THATH|nr:hypothetical protein FRX31_016987 [Thalictrum thalictroides]
MEPSSQSHGACHHHHFRLLHCSHHHHHHHHNQHHHPLCILKPHYLLPTTHNPVFHPNLHTTLCPLRYTSPPPPIPSQAQFTIPVSTPEISNLEVLEEPQLWQEEDVDEGEEEGDEPMFVMTDEWMEFFAKSEEKRRLEKKQAKMLKKAEKMNNKEGE